MEPKEMNDILMHAIKDYHRLTEQLCSDLATEKESSNLWYRKYTETKKELEKALGAQELTEDQA